MSKSEILAAIRAARVPDAPLPDLRGLGAPAADLVTSFAAALKASAGAVVEVRVAAELPAALATRYPDTPRVYSCVPGINSRDFAPPANGDPHGFAPVDLAVVPAAFGVAENGAVWIDTTLVPHRVCLFLSQHLAVVLSRTALEPHMHAAYARLAKDPLPEFGVFIAGPSKTADIEQCLVIGAHGARSLTVFLVG